MNFLGDRHDEPQVRRDEDGLDRLGFGQEAFDLLDLPQRRPARDQSGRGVSPHET